MKITNYNYGYQFDCVIRGKITMTYKEWLSIYRDILKSKEDDFFRDIFIDDVNRRIPTKNGFLINIRVSKTELIVRWFSLDKYKRQNYMLEVLQ